MLCMQFCCGLHVAVIGWLNKQINEQQMLGGRLPMSVGSGHGGGGSNSLPLSTIRHSSPLTFSSVPSHAQHMVQYIIQYIII